MTDHILPMPEDVDTLLARGLWPDASAEARADLEAWVGNDPARAALVARMRGVLPEKTPVHRAGAAWERVRTRLALLGLPVSVSVATADGAGHALSRPGAAGVRGARRWGWPSLAAVLTLALAAMIGWNVMFPHRGRRAATSLLTYTTANGERANITLPDGSVVSLNVASRLDVPADYAAGDHTVRLVGEALFTVVHHKGKPLTVVTPSATARVLGTSFLVREYRGDETATIAVREGRVAVRSVVLGAGQAVDVARAGTPLVHAADPAQFTFAAGLLTINGQSLADAVPALDRWYDADVRFGDRRLGARRVVGTFRAGSLADLVEVLRLSGVRVERAGRVVTLYSK